MKTPREYADMLLEAFPEMTRDTLAEMALQGWREGRFKGGSAKWMLEVLERLQNA